MEPIEIHSRNIPDPIQRVVRQRCGFGCVICGLPLYEYDHLLGWAKFKRHEAKEITLLCDQHHKEKTNGLLPEKEVLAADADPYNLRQGVSKPYNLHYSGTSCEAVIGTNVFFGGTPLIPIMIDGQVILGFRFADGHILLWLDLFDEFNQWVLGIHDNALVYKPDNTWDIQFVGQQLIVREAKRKILVDITFEVPKRIVINRGRFLFNGVEILVHPEYMLVTNDAHFLKENRYYNCGYAFGRTPPPRFRGMFQVPQIRRYVDNQAEAIKWAREIMENQ